MLKFVGPIERAQNFLRSAEKTGMLAEVERKAAARHDVRRRLRAGQLLDAMAQRQALLAAPAEVLRVAQAELERAAAAYRSAEYQFGEASRTLAMVECQCDANEGRLRRELRDCAPDCLSETWVKLRTLRMEVVKTTRSRTVVESDPHSGHEVQRYETNLGQLSPIEKWLQDAEIKLEEFTYEAVTAAELGQKCEWLLQEAKEKVAPLVATGELAQIFPKVA